MALQIIDSSPDFSVLSRFSQSALDAASPLSVSQAQVDSLVTGFIHESTQLRSIAAIMAGGLAYRLGCLGTASLPALSRAVGLASEATAFEGVNEILSPASQVPFLDRWRTSFLQFGLLKIAGAATLGQNGLAQHLVQDVAMVAGHQWTAQLGLTRTPEGSLAQQLLHAEVTNLQMGLGMALAHAWIPSVSFLERSMDLSLSSAYFRIFERRLNPMEAPLVTAPRGSTRSISLATGFLAAAGWLLSPSESQASVRLEAVPVAEGEGSLSSSSRTSSSLGEGAVLALGLGAVFGGRRRRSLKIMENDTVLSWSSRVLERLPSLRSIWQGLEGRAYRPRWIEELRDQSEQGGSALKTSYDHQYRETLDAAETRKISEERAKDRLAGILRDDYLERLSSMGLPVQEISWVEWLRGLQEREGVPPWVSQVLAEPAARGWRMFHIDIRNLDALNKAGFAPGHDYDSLIFSGGLLMSIQSLLRLPENALVEVSDRSPYMFQMPVEFLWRAAEYVSGVQGVRSEVVGSVASVPRIGHMLFRDCRPAIVSPRRWSLHQVESAHPYVSWEHDMYHIFLLNSKSFQARSEIVGLYQALRWVPLGNQSERKDHQRKMLSLLEGVYAENNGHAEFFQNLFSRGASPGYLKNVLASLRSSLPRFERGEELLNRMEEEARRARGNRS